MENSQLSKNRQMGSNEIRNERGMKIFQSVTLVFLALFWIGFAISYYRGIENNISTYGILILTFSLINQEVLFKGEKAQNKLLDVLAKAEGILLCAGALVTIIQLILK